MTTIEEFSRLRLGNQGRRTQIVAASIGIAGFALFIVSFLTNETHAAQSYLFSYTFWFSLPLGALGILLMNHVVGGRWGIATRRLLEAAIRTLPLMVILFLPLLIGMKDLYSWTHPEMVRQDVVLQHRQPYLNEAFFLIRTLLYFVIWLVLGFTLLVMSRHQDASGDRSMIRRMRMISAPGLILFTLSGTFAYIDWILSIDAHFFSTVYGAMILAGQFLQTFAWIIIVLVVVGRQFKMESPLDPQLFLDLGNMMFCFLILWAYLSLSQLIIVWPGNLPAEITWYLDRTRGGWKLLAAFIAIALFTLPFLLLLSRSRKKNANALVRVCVVILIARVIDLFWVIEPSFRKSGFTLYWSDLFAFVGVGGVWLAFYLFFLRRHPLFPLRDERFVPLSNEVAT